MSMTTRAYARITARLSTLAEDRGDVPGWVLVSVVNDRRTTYTQAGTMSMTPRGRPGVTTIRAMSR